MHKCTFGDFFPLVVFLVKTDKPFKKLPINFLLCFIIIKDWNHSFCPLDLFRLEHVLYFFCNRLIVQID